MEGKMKKIDYLVFLIMALISIIYLSSCGSEAVKQEMKWPDLVRPLLINA